MAVAGKPAPATDVALPEERAASVYAALPLLLGPKGSVLLEAAVTASDKDKDKAVTGKGKAGSKAGTSKSAEVAEPMDVDGAAVTAPGDDAAVVTAGALAWPALCTLLQVRPPAVKGWPARASELASMGSGPAKSFLQPIAAHA